MASARFLDPSAIPLKQQSGGNIWTTLIQITQAITIAVLLAGLMVFFLPVIQQTHHRQQEKDNLQLRIIAEMDQQQQLKGETELMKNDPVYLEHIARDRLNMGRPGETIIRFDPYQPAPATVPQADASSSAADSK